MYFRDKNLALILLVYFCDVIPTANHTISYFWR